MAERVARVCPQRIDLPIKRVAATWTVLIPFCARQRSGSEKMSVERQIAGAVSAGKRIIFVKPAGF
jgi:hypothetical protein